MCEYIYNCVLFWSSKYLPGEQRKAGLVFLVHSTVRPHSEIACQGDGDDDDEEREEEKEVDNRFEDLY